MDSMRDRLIDILANSGCSADFDTFKELADHLLENGVIVPPCEVGQTVWTKYGYTFKIEKIEILKDKMIFRCGNDGTDDYMAFFEDEIGKEVFLTKEEAEKALTNRKEN